MPRRKPRSPYRTHDEQMDEYREKCESKKVKSMHDRELIFYTLGCLHSLVDDLYRKANCHVRDPEHEALRTELYDRSHKDD